MQKKITKTITGMTFLPAISQTGAQTAVNFFLIFSNKKQCFIIKNFYDCFPKHTPLCRYEVQCVATLHSEKQKVGLNMVTKRAPITTL